MKKLIKKADPLFYERVGKYIELWLKENNKLRSKPRTQKELAYMLKKTPAQLSRWIRGVNTMPASVITALNHMHGFNNKYYDEYIAQKSDIHIDHLTKEDLFRVIRELQISHDRDKEMFSKYLDMGDRMRTENYKLTQLCRQLMEDNERLRKQLRELKKQLKLE